MKNARDTATRVKLFNMTELTDYAAAGPRPSAGGSRNMGSEA